MSSRRKVVLCVLALCATPQRAWAQASTNDIAVRCSNDQANTPEQIQGRNAWAKKCGYIDDADFNYNNARQRYVTFSDIEHAPWDGNAPCMGTRHVLGMCFLRGCYTPDQRLLFGGKYQTISHAALHVYTATVTALSPDWQLGENPTLVEEAVEHFVVGDEKQDVLRVVTDSGLSVEVTQNHPLVDAEGNVVEARSLKAGETHVLTAQGPALVSQIVARAYNGKVWNVEPKGMETHANLLVAEGFISGSIRFQNEWAQDATRLHLRKHLNTAAF